MQQFCVIPLLDIIIKIIQFWEIQLQAYWSFMLQIFPQISDQGVGKQDQTKCFTFYELWTVFWQTERKPIPVLDWPATLICICFGGGNALNPQMGCLVSVWPPGRTEFGTRCQSRFWRGCRKCLKSSCYKVLCQNPKRSFIHMKIFGKHALLYLCSPRSLLVSHTHNGGVVSFIF